ncbi:MAG: hypothetical protein ACO3ZY_04100 [Phycisphaerales bacterium]
MHADSAFFRRLTIVRAQGDAWSARVRAAAGDRSQGGWSTIRSILVAIPAMLLVAALLLIAFGFVLVFGAVAIAIGLGVAAFRQVRRLFGLGGAAGDEIREAAGDDRRVNVRVIDRG